MEPIDLLRGRVIPEGGAVGRFGGSAERVRHRAGRASPWVHFVVGHRNGSASGHFLYDARHPQCETTHRTVHAEGGHFAALKAPELFGGGPPYDDATGVPSNLRPAELPLQTQRLLTTPDSLKPPPQIIRLCGCAGRGPRPSVVDAMRRPRWPLVVLTGSGRRDGDVGLPSGGVWWSIEVFDGAFPATLWQGGHGTFLVEAALTRQARNWWWHQHDWGVVFEVEFDDEETWERFRGLPAVQAALDAVPDPIEGLLVYPGRGGSSGRAVPRVTRPTSGAGAAAMPIPLDDVFSQLAPDPRSTSADLAPF